MPPDSNNGSADEEAFHDVEKMFSAASPKPAPTIPQPLAVTPQRHLQKRILQMLPFRTADGTVYEEFSVTEVIPSGEGVQTSKVVVQRLRYASDGAPILTPADFRRSPKTGLTFTPTNAARCDSCGVQAYRAEMTPSLINPSKRVCPTCASVGI